MAGFGTVDGVGVVHEGGRLETRKLEEHVATTQCGLLLTDQSLSHPTGQRDRTAKSSGFLLSRVQ